ncbi:MAG: DNA repair protein RecO [Patescibacteria group bacterium]|nr:DNA repair protein RecO [Patescibacteria group bacterium]
MPTYRAEGLVIKRTSYSEADQILTIFTKNRGKVSAIAKGSRKLTSRKGGHLELLNHSIFSIAEGKSLDIITEAETVEPFSSIKSNLEKSSLGHYLAEFINEFLPDGLKSYSFFRLCLMALGYLNDAEEGSSQVLIHSFELKALAELGFAPEIRKCVLCQQPLTWGELNSFSPECGGVVCSRCSNGEGFCLDEDLAELLREVACLPWKKVDRIKVQKSSLEQLRAITRSYVEYVLEKRLKSPSLLEKIRNGHFDLQG